MDHVWSVTFIIHGLNDSIPKYGFIVEAFYEIKMKSKFDINILIKYLNRILEVH